MGALPTPKLPSNLQLLEWTLDPLGFMERNTAKFGDRFVARLGTRLPGMVFLSRPDDIRAILTAPEGTFDGGRANGILSTLVGQNSLLLMDGDRHKKERKLLMPPFHGDRMLTYGETICEGTRLVCDRQPWGTPFPVRSLTQEITMRVILKAVFGLSDGERYDAIRRDLTEVLDMTGSPLKAIMLFFPILQQDLGAWSPWGNFMRVQQRLDALLLAEIRDRRANPDPDRTDILTLLLSARDENGEGMTDPELRDELMTLLLAGHETTATALAWAMYWVHKLPHVRRKLLAELDALGVDADPMAIFKLPYLTAVCNETLRIYPVALLTFPRVVNDRFDLGDVSFERDTILAPAIYLTQRRPDIFPEPERFDPDRFLDRQYSPYEFYPFGGGNRRCLGMALALYELRLSLATLLREYEFELPDDRPIKPIRRGVTLAPSNNLEIVKKARRDLSVSDRDRVSAPV